MKKKKAKEKKLPVFNFPKGNSLWKWTHNWFDGLSALRYLPPFCWTFQIGKKYIPSLSLSRSLCVAADFNWLKELWSSAIHGLVQCCTAPIHNQDWIFEFLTALKRDAVASINPPMLPRIISMNGGYDFDSSAWSRGWAAVTAMDFDWIRPVVNGRFVHQSNTRRQIAID